jgi:hypothetical protein
VSFVVRSRCAWLRYLVVITVLSFAPPAFQLAEASEVTGPLAQPESETPVKVRSWEQEAYIRARQTRLAQRQFNHEQPSQGLIAESSPETDFVAKQQALLDAARGQPGLTGLAPLPASLFVP